MKIVYNRFIPIGKNFLAINIFGILFAKGKCDSITVNHEMIHSAQMKETAYIFFYLLYVIEWIVRIICYRSNMKAYYSLSFEREAYENQANMNYLPHRKPYAFLKYLFIR